MIKVSLVIGAQGEQHDHDCGVLEFAALPRVGEQISVLVSGEYADVSVAEVFHYPAGDGLRDSSVVVIRGERPKA